MSTKESLIPSLLDPSFLDRYPEFPPEMTPLGLFVFLRTYSRFLTTEKRRETYKETCQRAVLYNVGLLLQHWKTIGYHIDHDQLQQEAHLLFENMFHLRQFVSGRTLWIGGTHATDRCSLSNFNCAALNIAQWEDLCDLFYLLMVGAGVGFKSTKELTSKMSPIRNTITLIHSEYHPLPKHQRLEKTEMTLLSNGFAKIYVGDSKEGWVESLRTYLKILVGPEYQYIHTIKISYNSVRPRGERLKTFGGTSSGPFPLMEMFNGIDKTLKGILDPWLEPHQIDSNGLVHVRPIHIMDIGNLIGQNVVVGGTRRTAEMFIFDEDDDEVLFAKYGLNGFYTEEEYQHHLQLGHDLNRLGIKPRWFDVLSEQFLKEGHAQRTGLDHRRLSNNSIMFRKKPTRDFLGVLFQILRYEGEPGLINLEEMKRRRPNAELVNPCVTAETIVMTDRGPYAVRDLVGHSFNVNINGKMVPSSPAGFFRTGHKQIFRLRTASGHHVRLTDNHEVYVVRAGCCQFIPAMNLKTTDLVILNRLDPSIQWGYQQSLDKSTGWLLGLYMATHLPNQTTLKIGGNSRQSIMTYAVHCLGQIDQHVQYKTNVHYDGHETYNLLESRLFLDLVQRYQGVLNLFDTTKNMYLLTATSQFQLAYLSGFFETLSQLNWSQHGLTIYVEFPHQQEVETIQMILLNFGINSQIKNVGSMFSITISSDNSLSFCRIVTLIDPINNQIFNAIRNLTDTSKETFMDPFESLAPDGIEEVYDCTLESLHYFPANGIMVHNCGEVLLDTYQTCNLTTLNLTQFIRNDTQGLDLPKLYEAQKLSVRAGIRMTLVTLELPHWDQKQKRDRLIGVSLTGIKDTMDHLGYTKEQETELMQTLGDIARQESLRYAKEIRISAPLLVTTIKPEGSLSQLAGGVSQGLHLSHSPYFIRRIRIFSNDPMVEIIKKAHWRINPEVGTQGKTFEEKMQKAQTYVVDFPVASHAKKTKYQSNIQEQLETYFTYQKVYADHNCSNTISVKPEEWEQLPQLINDHWDQYLGVTFIPLDCGRYELAPYEECTQEEYQKLLQEMEPFDLTKLQELERHLWMNDDMLEGSVSIETDLPETTNPDCLKGVCPLK